MAERNYAAARPPWRVSVAWAGAVLVLLMLAGCRELNPEFTPGPGASGRAQARVTRGGVHPIGMQFMTSIVSVLLFSKHSSAT